MIKGSIEAGVRLYADDEPDVLQRKLALATSFGVFHFQLACASPNQYAAMRRQVEDGAKEPFEMSIYVDERLGQDGRAQYPIVTSDADIENLELLVRTAHESRAKFLVLSPTWALRSQVLHGTQIHLINDRAIVVAAVRSILERSSRGLFICLENSEQHSNIFSPDFFRSVTSHELNSWWFKIALNINTLTNFGADLKTFLRDFDAHIGLVMFDYSDAHQRRSADELLASSLFHLFWLPYKQRAFVLTDRNLTALSKALDAFTDIVVRAQLYYP
jgi:hypothetical protein